MTVKSTLQLNGQSFSFYALKKAEAKGLQNIHKLPKSLKVLLENLLRHESSSSVNWADIEAVDQWAIDGKK